jgi:hypothetical protein
MSRRPGPILAVLAALTLVAGAVSFATQPLQLAAASAPASPQQRLSDQLASCQAMRAVARTNADKAWADTCVRLARAALAAATPTPGPTATATPTGGPTTVPPTTAPPTMSPSPTASPTPSPTPTAGPWPDASTTGVPAGTTLTPHGSVTVTEDGTVIDGWLITGHLDVRADNVVVRNSQIVCTDGCLHNYARNLRVDRVEIDGGGSNIGIMDGGGPGLPATNAVYSGLNIHETDDGVRCDGSLTVVDSWIHDLSMGTAAHSDGCQVSDTDLDPDPGAIVFRHNVIEGGNTSCFIIQGNPRGISIVDNYLIAVSREGEQSSYAINVGASVPAGGVEFRDNVLTGGWQSGPDGSAPNYSWAGLWTGNTFTDGTVALP